LADFTMSEELNFLPSLTCSFAKSTAENPTVEMVETAYRHHGLRWRYINTEAGPELVTLLNDKTSTGAPFEKWNDDYSVADGVDVVINATSIGLYPDANARLALNLNSLSTDMVVADVISNPP
tara:strand:- start:252 stop:620 length:369 start_codon:yes stop_codon:yes gene_type:complete